MTKAELIKIEIEKTKNQLEKLQSLLKNAKGDAIEICPRCKTKNYHYYPQTDYWCCAFC